ncbi:hypothetical protein ACFY8Q_07205 [[Kitasatospora] papulosa]|uniref:hypothetical protein n=1 Tax=[Kitasatospora] papulosa TaxID=1464011 RepID=UPI003673A834
MTSEARGESPAQLLAAAEHRAEVADAVTAEIKRLMERRTATLRQQADRLAEELAERSKHDGRTEATLQRVRDAETLGQALAAVAEHDGLTPAQAAASAAFATAAEKPAAVEAEREREHAIRLATAEQARAEAVRVADRATSTLLRIRHARTAGDAWVILGEHYHMHSTDAGRLARRWRTTAEQAAADRARLAEEEHGLTCEQFNEAAAQRDQAEATIARVRVLLGTHLGPLATIAVRRALDTPTDPTVEPVTCEVSWHVHQATAPTTESRLSAPEEG